MASFLNRFISSFKRKKWWNKCYLSIDERGIHQEVFDLLDELQTTEGINFKLFGCVDNVKAHYKYLSYFTDLSISDTSLDKSEANNQGKKYIKGSLSIYSCTEHFPGNYLYSSPWESFWSVINAGKNSNGFLRWAYDAWVENPQVDATHNAFETGDCFLVYPQEKTNIVSSLRLMKMQEAFQMIIKLKQLSSQSLTLKRQINVMFDGLEGQAIITKDPYGEREKYNKIKKELTNFIKQFEILQNKLGEI